MKVFQVNDFVQFLDPNKLVPLVHFLIFVRFLINLEDNKHHLFVLFEVFL